MNVKISDFFEVFSGGIQSTLSISSEFLSKFWESFEIGLSFIISKSLSTSTKSALIDTNGSKMS